MFCERRLPSQTTSLHQPLPALAFGSLRINIKSNPPPGRVERSEGRVRLGAPTAPEITEVSVAIHRSTSPRFARPSCQEGDFKTTRPLSGRVISGVVKRRGFSLVELIVVMVILGMLAGLVAVRTRGYLVNSRKNAVKAEIATIMNALETFRIDQGRYPTEDEGLEILREETETWPEGFLTKMPVDPWKNPYLYFVSEEGVEVVSLGADGREGGDGEDADFSSMMLEE
ncbi:type II secretion system protein GspG [Rhodopirellula sp. SM50]|nr:type II secretion system protein GspG [Rhodopirellula sp. SM50]